MKRPKVGILCYNLEEFMTDCIKRISDNNVQFEIKAYPLFGKISKEQPGFEYERTTNRGKFFGVRNKGSLPEGFPKGVDVRLAWKCAHQSNIVMLMGLQGGTALATAIFARLLRKKLISINQTMPPQWEKKRRWWILLLKRILLRMCDYHVIQAAISKETLKEVYGLDEKKFYFAPFEAGAQVFENFRVQCGLKNTKDKGRDGERRFLFVGTMLRFKGIFEILAASKKLRDEGCEFVVKLVGPAAGQKDEPGLETYRQMVKHQNLETYVEICGPCAYKDLPNLYEWSDVLLLPTYKDVWPKVLVEAAICSRPSITTSVCASAYDLVVPEETGWIIEPGDIEGLYAAMSNVVKTGHIRLGEMGAAARKRCFDIHAPQMEAQGYQEVLSAAQGKGAAR